MDVETAIRTRRTHKAFGADPVDPAVLAELLELATWAPNHHLTNPWRLRVLGPAALARLKAATGPDGAAKLDRAPTLVAVSYVRTPGDPVADEEDLLAAGCAAYAVLLGAHGRGLAAYWRTPAVLRGAEGRAALGIPETEHCIGLLHLGSPRQRQRVPERTPAHAVVTYLD
jgi:nitroreductase